MRQRLLTAALLIPVVLGSLLAGPPVSVFFGFLVYALMQFEFSQMTMDFRPAYANWYTFVSLLPAAVLLQFGFEYFSYSLAVVVILLFAGVCCIVERERDVVPLKRLLLPVALGVMYLCILGALLPFSLSQLSPSAAIWLVFVIAISDTAAYIGGSAIGGEKLAPRISPKKTVAGMFCGIACSAIVGVLLGRYLFLNVSVELLFTTSVAVVCAGIFGDLAESIIKRCFEVKDSGSILPGHGGVLDRADALLFAVPVLLFISRLFGGIQ